MPQPPTAGTVAVIRGVRVVVVLGLAWLLASLAAAGSAFAQSADFEQPPSSPERARIGADSVARADFDGDGDQDLAVPPNGRAPLVLLNNGSGDFSRGQANEWGFTHVIAADLDRDGDQDLAAYGDLEGRVIILLNDGSAHFTEAPTSPEDVGDLEAFSFDPIESGDVDKDGDIDLAVLTATPGRARILLNNGSGDFSKGAVIPIGRDPFSVAAADLDGDGDQDLATTDLRKGEVFVLLNDGNGGFSHAATSPERAGGGEVVAADFDRDGDSDLASDAGDRVTILLNNGSGNFSEARTSPESLGRFHVVRLIAADLDRDGDPDLAITAWRDQSDGSSTERVFILLNDGSGDFRQPPTSPERAGFQAWALAAGDLDGDRDLDLAVGGFEQLTILLNRRTPAVNLRCTRSGGPRNDIIRGTPGNDVICARAGNDTVYGLGGNDRVLGQGGDDVVRGGPGHDRLEGGEGDDQALGGDGDDRLSGGPGRDTAHGQDGRDTLDTRDGVRVNDVANGGAGADSCTTDRGDARTSC